MRRQAFLLGLFATGSQTLLLRELISTLNGSELCIGTALFGWLIWVAVGSYVGGKLKRPPTSSTLFLIGALALPVLLVVCRVSPLAVTATVGELIPFSIASLLSILVTLPHGFLSGLLFPAITREAKPNENAILRVYLIEGLGAGAAGVAVTLVAGYWMSTLAAAILLSAAVAVGSLATLRMAKLVPALAVSAVAVTIVFSSWLGRVERALEQARYPGFVVLTSFDTPYTHQAVLTRDSAIVLMTDNTVEAIYPDMETDENLLLPARAYLNTPLRSLVAGRTEFGLAKMADAIGGVKIRAVDPRGDREFAADSLRIGFERTERIRQDLIQYLSPHGVTVLHYRPNVVIVPVGDLSSFRSSRLVCRETLHKFRRLVRDSGLLVLLTRFDTDRYVSPAVADILGTIRAELSANFSYVAVWPGTATLILAGNANLFDISNDTLFARLSRLDYQPQYVHEMYLHDRLHDMKLARVAEELNRLSGSHRVDRPTLVMKQALFRANANATDRLIASAILGHPLWLLVFPIAMIGLLGYSVVRRDRQRRLGLPLYVIAGFISFVVELLIFYLYQSNVGSLHAELAALIGVFMLGLSCGTYVGRMRGATVVERGSLLLIALAMAALLCWNGVGPLFFAPYAFVLMFLTAVGTGGLFAAATRRYYADRNETNSGLGYALEISGSAIAALLTTTILLPTIGITWILIACLIVAGLAGLVSVAVPPAH